MLSDGEVTLRPLRAEDASTVIAHLQEPDIARWTRVPTPYGQAEFDEWVAAAQDANASGAGLHLAIADGSDRVIGAVGVQGLDTETPDIGYWVAREARRRGVATRAVRLLRDWLASERGRPHVEILVHPDNTPSQR